MPKKMKSNRRTFLLAAAAFALLAGLFCCLIPRMRSRTDKAYDALILKYATRYNQPPELVKAIIWKESHFNPQARGAAGEIGLMQLMPAAVEQWRQGTKSRKPTEKELFEPEKNIEIGSWYLAWTGKHWANHKSARILQLSEYNAGYGKVSRNWRPKSPDDEVKISDITIKSTRAYITAVLRKTQAYQADFQNIPNQP